MIKYKINRKIVDCEKNGKMESVTSHDLYPPPPLSQTVTLSQTFSPLWSVTYFMDGPCDILLGGSKICEFVTGGGGQKSSKIA